MKMINNTARRTGWIWICIGLAAVVLIFVPGVIGMDGMRNGYAVSFLAAFLAAVSIIAASIYFQFAKRVDNLNRPENRLVYWTYSPEQWRSFTENEYHEDKTAKWNLFLIIASVSVLVGIGLWLGLRADGLLIALIMTGIIVMMAITALVTAWYNHYQNQKQVGEAVITRDGAVLNRQIHIWKGIGTKLENILYDGQNRSVPVIRIEYSASNKNQRNRYTARIPVPPGQEDNARKVVNEIQACHQRK